MKYSGASLHTCKGQVGDTSHVLGPLYSGASLQGTQRLSGLFSEALLGCERLVFLCSETFYLQILKYLCGLLLLPILTFESIQPLSQSGHYNHSSSQTDDYKGWCPISGLDYL